MILFTSQDVSDSKIFDPNTSFKVSWDILVILLAIYTIVIVPLRTGFRLVSYDSTSYLFDFFVDVLYFFEILITFNTAYPDQKKASYIFHRLKIAKRYLSTWFLFDVIGMLPFTVIISKMYANRIWWSTVTLRGYFGHMDRRLYLLNLIKVRKFVESKRLKSDHQNQIKAFNLIVLFIRLLTTTHLMACVWYFIASYDDSPNPMLVVQTSPSTSNSSCTPDSFSNTTTYEEAYPDTWVYSFGFGNSNLLDRYIASVYFCTTTMLTIGYGDIHAVNTTEQMFSIALELVGIITFSAIVAEIVNFVKNFDPKERDKSAATGELRAYLDERPLPSSLIARTQVCIQNYDFRYQAPLTRRHVSWLSVVCAGCTRGLPRQEGKQQRGGYPGGNSTAAVHDIGIHDDEIWPRHRQHSYPPRPPRKERVDREGLGVLSEALRCASRRDRAGRRRHGH